MGGIAHFPCHVAQKSLIPTSQKSALNHVNMGFFFFVNGSRLWLLLVPGICLTGITNMAEFDS